jgi:uncharacterized membrane protein YgcG
MITTVLHDITEQEIPNDMQSLWPALQRQLNGSHRSTRHMRSLTRLGWVTLIVVLSLMVGAGAYAFFQRGEGSRDSGLTHVQDQHLITQIGDSITIGDVTVTLDWVYADAHRVAVEYHIDTQTTSDMPLAALPVFPSRLTDDQGREFPLMFGGGGGGGGGGGSGGGGGEADAGDAVEPTPMPITMLSEASENFDASIITSTPDMLNLTFEVLIGLEPRSSDPQAQIDSMASGSSGGGGGGGGGGSP